MGLSGSIVAAAPTRSVPSPSRAAVVLQDAAEPPLAPNFGAERRWTTSPIERFVAESSMRPLAVIMGDVLGDGPMQHSSSMERTNRSAKALQFGAL